MWLDERTAKAHRRKAARIVAVPMVERMSRQQARLIAFFAAVGLWAAILYTVALVAGV